MVPRCTTRFARMDEAGRHLDEELKRLNDDYAVERGSALHAPMIKAIPSRAFLPVHAVQRTDGRAEQVPACHEGCPARRPEKVPRRVALIFLHAGAPAERYHIWTGPGPDGRAGLLRPYPDQPPRRIPRRTVFATGVFVSDASLIAFGLPVRRTARPAEHAPRHAGLDRRRCPDRVRRLSDDPAAETEKVDDNRRTVHGHYIVRGFLMNTLNPMVLLFWLA